MGIRVAYGPDVGLLGAVAGATGKAAYDERAQERILRAQMAAAQLAAQQNAFYAQRRERRRALEPERETSHDRRVRNVREAFGLSTEAPPEVDPVAFQAFQEPTFSESYAATSTGRRGGLTGFPGVGLGRSTGRANGPTFAQRLYQDSMKNQNRVGLEVSKQAFQKEKQLEDWRQRGLLSENEFEREMFANELDFKRDLEMKTTEFDRQMKMEEYKDLSPYQRGELGKLDQERQRIAGSDEYDENMKGYFLHDLEQKRSKILAEKGPPQPTVQEQWESDHIKTEDGRLVIRGKNGWEVVQPPKESSENFSPKILSEIMDSVVEGLTRVEEVGSGETKTSKEVKPSKDEVAQAMRERLEILREFMPHAAAPRTAPPEISMTQQPPKQPEDMPPAEPKSQQEYDELPSGSLFVHQDGSLRRKK